MQTNKTERTENITLFAQECFGSATIQICLANYSHNTVWEEEKLLSKKFNSLHKNSLEVRQQYKGSFLRNARLQQNM